MRRLVAVAGAMVLAVAACSDGGQEPGTANPTAAEDGPDASDAAEAGPADVESPTGAVLATAAGTDGSTPLRMELNAVRRRGETVSITFGVTNEGTERWQVATFFDGPFREDLDTSFTMAGVSLIDTVNSRRYPVLFGEDGVCACDGDLSGRFVGPGETGRFSALTGAPPATVTTVDVQVPGFGTFSAVPLTDR